jgi:hypothetical protein
MESRLRPDPASLRPGRSPRSRIPIEIEIEIEIVKRMSFLFFLLKNPSRQRASQ